MTLDGTVHHVLNKSPITPHPAFQPIPLGHCHPLKLKSHDRVPSPSSMSTRSEDPIPYSYSQRHSQPSPLRAPCETAKNATHVTGMGRNSQTHFRLQAHRIVQNNCHLNSKRLEISVLRIWFKAKKNPVVPTGCSHNRTINTTAFLIGSCQHKPHSSSPTSPSHTQIPVPSLSLSLRTYTHITWEFWFPNWRRKEEILVRRKTRKVEEKNGR